jgi:isocitrate dehydrogenase (NAD+)
MLKIAVIPGDGIGPEVTEATVAVIEATGAPIEWETVEAGGAVIPSHGTPLPSYVLDSIRKNRVALKGPLTTPIGKGFQSVNVTLRKELDLYASVRPIRSMPGVKSRYSSVDLVVFRENTEGLYSGLEHEVVPGVVEGLKVITRPASERIARFAFEYCRHEGRRKLTVVHKASIMKLSDGLFLDAARAVKEEYPFVEYEERLIDNVAMQLALDPLQFDTLLMENLYGDVLSDLCAGLVGGLGLVPGANIGQRYAVFEAVHGSAPDIAGKGVANPIALLQSAVLLLRHIGERDASRRIERAIRRVLSEGRVLTRDLGGHASTKDFARAVIAHLEPASPRGQEP